VSNEAPNPTETSTAEQAPLVREYYTQREIAEYLGLSYDYIKELTASGAMRSAPVKAGRKRLVKKEWADAWVEGKAA
jgi:excisionase family DNA binding protein